jgi:hypothetical protein
MVPTNSQYGMWLSALLNMTSMSGMSLQITHSNIIFQEAGQFENSILSPSFKGLTGQALCSFKELYKSPAWKITILRVIHDTGFCHILNEIFVLWNVMQHKLVVTNKSWTA